MSDNKNQNINPNSNPNSNKNANKAMDENIKKNFTKGFINFQANYFISSLLLAFFAMYTYSKYGLTAGELMPEGTWFVLGGFSLFYPTSLLILPFAIVLFFYSLVTLRNIKVWDQNDRYVIEEKFIWFRRQTTEIKRDEIQLINLDSTHSGTRSIWLIIFSIHMIALLTDGLHLLLNPHEFGYGSTNGWLYVITALIDLVIICLIILPNEINLNIHTKEQIHKLRIASPMQVNAKFEFLSDLFGLRSKNQMNSKVPPMKFRNIFRIPEVLWGFVFIAIAILSKIFMVFAGAQLRLVLYLIGMLLILKGLKRRSRISNKISSNTSDVAEFANNPYQISEKNEVFHSMESSLGENRTCLNNCAQENIQIKSQLTPKDGEDFLLLTILPLLTTWTITSWFRFVPNLGDYVGLAILYILGVLLIIIAILDCCFQPCNQLICKTLDEKNILLLGNNIISKKSIKNWGKNIKKAYSSQPPQFLIQISIFVGMLMLGIIFGLIV